MNYWWVNHKQTYRAELSGGYIWSPKTKSNGQSNQTYDNLRLVKAGDVVFSFAFGLIQAVGIAERGYQEAPKPVEFGAAGAAWSHLGWFVNIEWHELDSPLAPKKHLGAISPLLPSLHSPIRAQTGDGNQGCYLASISPQLGQELLALISLADTDSLQAAAEFFKSVNGDAAELSIAQSATAGSTESEQLIRARRGQGRFKSNVMSIEAGCRLTGVSHRQFLIASHIKPWAVSSNEERLDGHNGLLLAPHIDLLFDGGWISFEDSGTLLVADQLTETTLAAWGVDVHERERASFKAKQCAYLAYHRKHVFKLGFKLGAPT